LSQTEAGVNKVKDFYRDDATLSVPSAAEDFMQGGQELEGIDEDEENPNHHGARMLSQSNLQNMCDGEDDDEATQVEPLSNA